MTYVPSRFCTKMFDITRGQGRHGQRLVGKHATSQTLPIDATSTPTRRELFGALFSSFAVNRTRCIIGKAAVSVEISYFEHIFIIIYSYIPLYTILYIPFTYFYNYIFFMFRIFCLFLSQNVRRDIIFRTYFYNYILIHTIMYYLIHIIYLFL